MIYGAKWWKVDFHMHTPASHDFQEPQISCREYLLAAMQKELDSIVITDHDCCSWIEDLRTELERMKSEKPAGYRALTIFPGVELEVFPAIHLIAIFDPQKPIEEINATISCIKTSRSPLNFQDAVKTIQDCKGIALPAHADDTKGVFQTLEGNALRNALDNCDFFATEVVDATYTLPQLCIDMKCEYTYVMGSDAHNRSNIGRRFSWVKMESPTIESLALAFQDGEDGIITDGRSISNPNILENRCYIEDLTIYKGQKIGNGTAFDAHFSPWLNTIIGGRGSGKTAITEFLRIVLDKTQNLPKEINETYKKFAKVPDNRKDVGMLRNDTKIETIIIKDGRRLKLIWESGTWSEYHEEGHDWVLSESVGDVNQRFPIHIYGQKQLYEMAEEPNCLIHYIDGLFDFDAWSQQLEGLSEKYTSLCREEREVRGKILKKSSFLAQLSDLDAKIEMLESATNNPVIATIKTYSSMYSKFKSELETIQSKLSEMQDDIIQTTLVSQDDIGSILDNDYSEQYKAFVLEWSALISEYLALQEKIALLIPKADELQKQHEDHISLDFKRAKEEYSQTILALKQQGIDDIDELDSLYAQHNILKERIDEIIHWESYLEEVTVQKNNKLTAIINHQKLLREERNRIISNLNSDQVRITLLPMQDAALAEEEFRSIIRKDSQFQTDIFDIDNIDHSFIGQICSPSIDEMEIWEKRERTISNFLDHQIRSRSYGKRFSDYIATLCKEHPSDIDALSMWVPPDAIQLEIKMNGQFSNIAQGSAGQKTTALLSLILHSNTGPLIVDQPEDDLDTKLISEMLVTELRNQKAKNQVIVVTHNPNIPVNGAAEQILAMNFVNGQIQCKFEGALQNQIIRNEICDVMEGGRDALKKRYFRIYKPLYQ
ncbi:TrlF family AAA-like ATPase [Faecalimonas sp.]